MKTELLDAEWKTGDTCEWVWQAPTRVSGFEIEDAGDAELISIVVGHMEQLLAGPVALAAVLQSFPDGVPESPAPGWKLDRVALPAQPAGQVLRVQLRGFRGRIRPFGVQVPF